PSQLETIASKAQVAALVKSLPTYRFNLTKAKQELAMSAYPNGFTQEWNTTDFVPNVVNISQAIAGNLAKIGINLKVNSVTIGDWIKMFNSEEGINPSYVIFAGLPNPGFFPGRVFGSKQSHGGGQNFARWTPPIIDDLISEGIKTTNHAKRFQ